MKTCLFICFIAFTSPAYSQGSWVMKANFGGTPRWCPIGFSIGLNGYIGIGYDSTNNYADDFWQWNQATDTWTQKANFAGGGAEYAVAFSIGSKGYVGTGTSAIGNEFWEYDTLTN